LLGKPGGKLRRRRHSCLERRETLGRKRPVRERGQLGDLLTARFILSTASQHGNRNGNAEPTQRVITPWRTLFGRTYSQRAGKNVRRQESLAAEPSMRRGGTACLVSPFDWRGVLMTVLVVGLGVVSGATGSADVRQRSKSSTPAIRRPSTGLPGLVRAPVTAQAWMRTTVTVG
jgi:hypothetical protein